MSIHKHSFNYFGLLTVGMPLPTRCFNEIQDQVLFVHLCPTQGDFQNILLHWYIKFIQWHPYFCYRIIVKIFYAFYCVCVFMRIMPRSRITVFFTKGVILSATVSIYILTYSIRNLFPSLSCSMRCSVGVITKHSVDSWVKWNLVTSYYFHHPPFLCFEFLIDSFFRNSDVNVVLCLTLFPFFF